MIKSVKGWAVHCKTQGEYDTLLKMLLNSGFTCPHGMSQLKLKLQSTDTCINISERELRYSTSAHYKGQGYRIVSVAELCKTEVCTECNGTGTYVGLFVTEPCKKCVVKT